MQTCTFCDRYYPLKHLTPLYDKNRPPGVMFQCERCLDNMKCSLIPRKKDYLWFWKKGSTNKGENDLYYLIDVERTNKTKVTHYWCKDAWGYTTDFKMAGLFTEDQAKIAVDDDISNYTVMIKKETVEKILNE